MTLQTKFTPDMEMQKYIYDTWHSYTQIFKFQICYLNHIWAKTYVWEWIPRVKVDLHANFRKNRRMFQFFALFLTINRYYQMGTNLTVFWLCKVTPSKFRNMRTSAKCNFLTLHRNSEQIIGSKFRRYVTFDTAKEIYTR